ncbi:MULTISPECIES: arginine--tRNA ligase [Paenibacillus]|uniref:arginine--tRNA ligase n=1 Tax=Paenibacillus TaxID=44249 RepID=UPI0022B8AAAA|nr:arginine--tRNA ligase [Paenibacillus caseinilyticus]MCZ8520225.1 arginine--tRNA ligase [Paenibacillus caseinilyticus]
MISRVLAEAIEQQVNPLFEEVGVRRQPVAVRVELPALREHGDYAAAIAMPLAKILRMPPMKIAESLRSKLLEAGSAGGLIDTIEVVPPGYLNFRVNWRQWAHTAGFGQKPDDQGKVIIEHTSINPNKSAHIGHLRNACIGDTLVRLLRRNGRQVEVHNYIDDLGNQLADTVVSLLHSERKGEHERFGDFCWESYAWINKEYANRPELAAERTRVLQELEEGQSAVAWMGMLTAERMVREHLEEMRTFGIEYDLLVWESSIVKRGFWEAAFELLKMTSSFHKVTEGEQAGCWVLQPPEEQQESGGQASGYHTAKVLVRSNGILTYTAKDIAYHLWKFGLLSQEFQYRAFDGEVYTTQGAGQESGAFGKASQVINVIDYRQAYPQAMVKQSLENLGYKDQADRLFHVSYGVVSLSPATAGELGIDTSDGRASYAMSGRQGIGIRVAELLQRMEEVIDRDRPGKDGLPSRSIAAAAIRYYLLRFHLSTEVVFDLKQATELTGNTGVYVLYAHARAATLLAKAGSEGEHGSKVPEEFPPLEPAELALLRQISLWEDTLHTAAAELAPHQLCAYAYELGACFNTFYSASPILSAGQTQRSFRIWLTARFKGIMGEALHVLGLPAPERL